MELNPEPLDHESFVLTARPRLSPLIYINLFEYYIFTDICDILF